MATNDYFGNGFKLMTRHGSTLNIQVVQITPNDLTIEQRTEKRTRVRTTHAVTAKSVCSSRRPYFFSTMHTPFNKRFCLIDAISTCPCHSHLMTHLSTVTPSKKINRESKNLREPSNNLHASLVIIMHSVVPNVQQNVKLKQTNFIPRFPLS